MAPTLAALGDLTKAALTLAQIKTEMTAGFGTGVSAWPSAWRAPKTLPLRWSSEVVPIGSLHDQAWPPTAPRPASCPALRCELRTEMKFATWLYGTFGLSLDVLPPTLLDHVPPARTPTSLRLATWQPGA